MSWVEEVKVRLGMLLPEKAGSWSIRGSEVAGIGHSWRPDGGADGGDVLTTAGGEWSL